MNQYYQHIISSDIKNKNEITNRLLIRISISHLPGRRKTQVLSRRCYIMYLSLSFYHAIDVSMVAL